MKDCDGNTPLYMAVRYINASDDSTGAERVGSLVIQALIDAGADVLSKNKWDVSPLHSVKDAAIARLLINAGAEINPLDDRANTPLYYAASSDNLPLIKVLIEAGADPDLGGTSMTTVYDANGQNPQQIAFASGQPLLLNRINPEALSLLINAGANVNIRDASGQTPLHMVKDLAAAQLLIDAGADVNLQDDRGNTPLHGADNPALTKLLIGAGAIIDQKNNQGSTAFHKMFGPYRASSPSLSSVQMWIGAGLDINEQGGRGMTVLHGAADHGDPQIITAIIDAGADVNMQDNYGSTALHIAARRNNLQVVQMLIDAGAKVNTENSYGSTPIFLAVTREFDLWGWGSGIRETPNSFIVKALIDAGANVNVVNNDKKTPLTLSTQFNYIRSDFFTPESFDAIQEGDELYSLVETYNTWLLIQKLLIDAGADVNVMSGGGETFLSNAVRTNSDTHLIQMIINAGADLSILLPDNNHSVIHISAFFTEDSLVTSMLIDAGADINALTDDGKTPLDYANERSNSQVVQLLQTLGAKTGSKVRD